MSTPTPAGWYVDPDDEKRKRYWNGAKWTDHYQMPLVAWMKRPKAIVAYVAVGCVAASFAVSVFHLDKPAGDGSGDSARAISACEQSVLTNLKSPGSADFGGESANASGTTWTVSGYVDAENSFGANLRSNWTCRASQATGSSWNATSIILP